MPLVGPELSINTGTAGSQSDAVAAGLSNGQTVVAWKDPNANLYSFKLKILNADGTTATADLSLGNPTAFHTPAEIATLNSTDLQLAALDNGKFVAVWRDIYTVSTGPAAGQHFDSVVYQVFNADGTAATVAAYINDNSSLVYSGEFRPAIVGTPGGHFTIAWEDTQQQAQTGITIAHPPAIWAKSYDSTGAVVTGQQLIGDAWGFDGHAAIAYSTGLNTTTVVWDDDSGPSQAQSGHAGIYGNEMIGGLANAANGFMFRADAASNSSLNVPLDGSPSVAFDGEGDQLTVWSHYNSNTTKSEVWASLDSGGTILQQLSLSTTNAQNLAPKVVGFKEGDGFLVVWTDGGASVGGSDQDVIGEIVYRTNVGLTATGEFTITSGSNINVAINTVAATELLDGRVMVTWDASNGTTIGTDIRASIIDPRAAPIHYIGTGIDEQIVGTDFAPASTPTGFPPADDIRTGAGNDIIWGGAGDDYIQAGTGNNTVHGGDGNDMLSFYDLVGGINFTLGAAGSGNYTAPDGSTFIYDTIESVAGSDDFGTGDTLKGNAGDNKLLGFGGNDVLKGTVGNDLMDGGLSTDTVDYSTLSNGVAITVQGANGTAVKAAGGGTDTLVLIEKVIGTAFNDVFTVDAAESVVGGGGFNVLLELTGGVSFNLGDANHTGIQEIVLAGGTNSVGLAAGDTDFSYIYGGGAGSTNTLTLGSGGGYEFATGGTNHMFGGLISSATYVFIGGVGTSDMHGFSGTNVYYVGANDTAIGASILDLPVGATSYNTLVELASGVTLNIGANHINQVILNGGTNSVDVTGSADFVYLYGGAGTNTMRLGAGGGYELSTGGINHMFGGSSGTDVFVGGVGTSDMHGGTGNNLYYAGAADTVFGSAAAGSYNTLLELALTGVNLTLGSASLQNVQQFIFYAGNNTLDASSATSQVIVYGGTGNDRIGGGTGNDFYWGSSGANTFVMKDHWGADTIMDWGAGSGNKIDMTALAGVGVHSMANLTISVIAGADVVTHGADSITLSNFSGTLTASSFLFA